jgi:type I restriction enzyme S subunit
MSDFPTASIPVSWIWSRIEDVATTATGGTPSRSISEYFGGRIPWVKSGELGDGHVFETEETLSELGLQSSNAKLFPKGTLCIALYGATVGKLGILEVDAATNQAVCGLFLPAEVDRDFVFHYLASIRRSLIEQGKGGAQSNISNGLVRQTWIPIAPLNEQRRIVAKIDELFSDLDAGVAALKRAKANLKRYRDAVLKAAVEGKLTEEWRATHPTNEPASALLARILKERRQKWEAEQLARFTAAGKEPPKNWRDKYVEPAAPETTGLPELPDGWCWANVGQLITEPTCNGISIKGADSPPGVPALRLNAMTANGFDYEKRRYIPISSDLATDLAIRLGDLFVSRGNGSLHLVGRGVLAQEPPEEIVFPDTMIRVRLFDIGSLRRFISHVWSSRLIRQQVEKKARTTAGIYKISQRDVEEFVLPLPSKEEQSRLVEEIEEKLTQISAAEQLVEADLLRAARLRQSILKRAFEGKLVPQDPTELPISKELLARIARQTEDTISSKKKRNQQAHDADAGGGTPMDTQLTAIVAPYLVSQRQAIRLHSLHFDGQFRSLSSPSLNFNRHYQENSPVSPVCLVGLNGSGKSNLIELLAVILCDLELALIGYSKLPQSIKQMKGQPFHLSFSITPKRGKADGILHIARTEPPKPRVIFSLEVEGESHEISDAATQLDLLPSRVVSYSSGLNETLSVPFLRNQAYYSEQVTQEAFGKRQSGDHGVKDIVTTYMDYDCNAAILLANFLFRTRKQLSIFLEAIRVKSLETFSISYRLKRPPGGRSVQLTKELTEILKKLRQCASTTTKLPAIEGEQFHYHVDRECQRKLREAFGSAGNLFNCLNKWSQLNSLSLSKRDREYYLRSEDTSSMLERPPAVSREDRIFLIDDVQLRLSSPDAVVGYTGLSDGEHQFVQVFGSLLLFDEPGTLFLFDEPETHFNPQWRRFFVDYLNKIESTKKQEVVISTHSPFVVSGCHREGVFKFVRHGDLVAIDRCSLETFGCSYEVLLSELFNLSAMISEQAVVEMKEILKKDDADEIVQDAAKFGESMEKRFLFERAAEIRSGGSKK